jgi:hypothetical protein
MRHGLLGVSAAGYQGHRAIADFPPLDRIADCDDFAGDLHPYDFRRARRRRIESLTLQNVSAIHAGSVDANQNFLGLDRRFGNFADLERAFIARFFNDYCFHEFTAIYL